MRKVYTCHRWPSLHLGSIQFRDGQYTTDDESVQAMIENSDSFGHAIECIDDTPRRQVGRPRGSTVEPEDVPPPPARQGTTGTGSLR